MDFGAYEIVYIISNIFMAYVLYKFMGVFYNENVTNRKIELTSYCLYFIVISFFHIYIKIPMVLMIVNILLFFIITFNYKSSLRKRILTALLIYTTLLCVETIVVFLSGFLNLNITSKSDYESILGIIIIRIISYVVVLSIENYKNIRQGDVVSKIYWLCIVIIPIGTLYLLVTIFIADNATFTSVFISTVIVLLINFATFYLYDDLSRKLSDEMEKKLMTQQNRYYKNQFELMKTSQETTKSLKHDLKNHLTCIYALAKDEKSDGLVDYLSEALEVVDTKKELAATGNITIDSIINFKLQDVREDNIDITVELNIPSELNIQSFDMTVILGNLLDNAINAVSKLDKNRYIKIGMKYTKGRLIIKVCNSYNGILNEKEGEFLTTNKDKDNHGIGLQNVKSVLEKYNGTIDYEHDGNNFYSTLLMYV